MRFFLLMFAAATSIFSADIRWGPAESGLQLGIAFTSAPEPVLRISLKNAGVEPRDLLIGYEGSVDLYNAEFTAWAPAVSEQPVLDLKAHPASLILPITAHLRPGEIREFIYPLSRLICVVNGRDVPFRTLLDRGYSVRARFELPGVALTSPDFSL